MIYTPDRLIVTFYLRPLKRPREGPIICHPIECFQTQRVSLRKPIGERALFDGSASPPKLVWDNPTNR